MTKKQLSEIFAGLILVSLGLLFFLSVKGIITGWWKYFLLSLGGIFILDAFLRFLVLKENFFGGRFITGVILLAIGTFTLLQFQNWWPIILIAIGLGIILKGIFGGKEGIQT